MYPAPYSNYHPHSSQHKGFVAYPPPPPPPPPPLPLPPPPGAVGNYRTSAHHRKFSQRDEVGKNNELPTINRFTFSNLSDSIHKQSSRTRAQDSVDSSSETTSVPTSLTDMEQIKLMEKRIEALKQENAKKLVEANEVLTYLNRDPKKEIQGEDDRSETPRLNDLSDSDSQVPVSHHCQTPGEHSNSKIDDKQLIANDEDLVRRAPCGSEFSSVVPRSCHDEMPMTSSGSHHLRQTVLSTTNSETDDLTHRDESGSESSSSTEKPVHNGPKMMKLSETTTLGTSPVEDALNINTEHQMLEEIATLRQDLSVLKRQMVGLHHGQFSHETHTK